LLWRRLSIFMLMGNLIVYFRYSFSLFVSTNITSCKQAAATTWSRPSPPSVGAKAPRVAEPTDAPADGNVAVGRHPQYVLTLTATDDLTPWWVKRPGDLDLWPFDHESDIRVTCDVGYLCANFRLRRPLCPRLRLMYATDVRQTDVRQHHHPRLLGAGHNNSNI